jgi:RHS repeat-associated protein
MLISPLGFEQAARASLDYTNISASDWATSGDSVEYEYDDSGRMITKTTNASTVESYEYNNLDRLVRYTKSIGTTDEITEYRYNPDGVRVEKHTWTEISSVPQSDDVYTSYLVDSYNHTGYAQTIEETVDDGTPETTTYTIGDDIISQYNVTDGAEHLLYDGHGSTRQIADYDGTNVVVDSYGYDAYGVMLGGNPTTASPAGTNLLYAGEHFDTDSQNYYNRARWYNPLNGRFNRMDPYAGNRNDPQSLHKYLYVHNNPINSIDPYGLFTLSEIVSVQSITKLTRKLNIGKAYMVYDRADTAVTAINLFNQWRASGRIDYLSLALLAAAILPLGKIMGKVKVGANKIIGASDDLTKLMNQAGKRTNKIVQSIGELGAEITARAKKFKATKFVPKYHGFDQIYKKGGRFIIVEAKGGTGRLAGKQMSKEWIRKNILKMADDSINGALGKELKKAWAEVYVVS